MKHLLVLSTLGLMLASCGKSKLHFIPAPTPPVVNDVVQQDINSIISSKNKFRAESGLTPFTTGLMCQLFTYTTGTRLQATLGPNITLGGLVSIGYFEYKGSFNQSDSDSALGNNVMPEPFKSLYKNNYKISCQGQIVIRDSGYFKFETSTDDASLLYINGTLLIDNDNSHGITSKSNIRLLERGVHTFRFDYAQGNGNQALIIKMNEELIDSRLYYR